MSANQPAQKKSNSIVLGAAFGVIALALVLAIALTGGDEKDASTSAGEFGTPTVSGLLPEVPSSNAGDASADPAFGMPIPEIAGQDFSGTAVNVERDGRPKAILFVSHSCGHCQAEIPEVQAWIDESGGVDGVDLIAVSTSAAEVGGNWPPSEWLESEGWSSPVIADDEELSAFFAYGGSVIPYWVFADADGNVTRRFAGRLEMELVELAMLEARG